MDSAPVEAHARLKLTPRYEYASVPGEDPPAMGVLLDIEAHGDPIVSLAGPVAHVILVLDLSASMNKPDKYPVLERALGAMLDDMHATGAADILLSVVIFSRGAEVLFSGIPARGVTKEELLGALRRRELYLGDYTDIPGALTRAGRIAYEQWKKNRRLPVRLYLFTDGKPQDVERTLKNAERVSKVPVDLHGFAFGSDANVAVMQEMFAGRRGGTVKSITADTISTAFERISETAQKVVATKCPVELVLRKGVVGGDAFRYRPARVHYPQPAFPNRRFTADLGTIETGRVYSLLFEVRPRVAKGEVSEIGEVTVRIPSFGGPVTEKLLLTIPRTPAGTEPGELDRSVREARDILRVLTDKEPATALRSLKLRRKIYLREKRDPSLLALLDRAILMLETTGSLGGLSPDEYATLLSHTCTAAAGTE